MSNISKLIDSLSPFADDVARAAGEFGDDAVRSIMKATPAMRKRLAALAEKRIASSAESLGSKAWNKQNRWVRGISPPQPTRVNEMLMQENVDALGKYLKKSMTDEQFSHPMVRSIVKNNPTYAARRTGELLDSSTDFADPAQGLNILEQLATEGDIGRDVYNNAVLDIAQGSYPSIIDAPRVAKTKIDDLIAGLYPNGPGWMYPEEALIQRANLPAATSQLNLAALLRMIGDAQ